MIFPLMLLAGVAAQPVQGAATPPAQAHAAPFHQGPGRSFLSPMGEPFSGRTDGEDGLVVWFEQADRNHDGVLTPDEMRADAERFFATLDRNHDGEIDPDDITYYEQEVAPQIRVAPSYSAGAGMDERAAGRYGLLQYPEPVVSADTNWDRGVSLDEFRSAASRRFQLLDVNHTGRLTLAQLEDIRGAARDASRRAAPPKDQIDAPLPSIPDNSIPSLGAGGPQY